MKISEKTIQALKILNVEYEVIITAKIFAEIMWKDSPRWKRVHNIGNGATQGSGMWLCAGSYLWKLQKAGLAKRNIWHNDYAAWIITEEGINILKNEENNDRKKI